MTPHFAQVREGRASSISSLCEMRRLGLWLWPDQDEEDEEDEEEDDEEGDDEEGLGLIQQKWQQLFATFDACLLCVCCVAMGPNPGYPPVNIPIPTKIEWVVHLPQNGITSFENGWCTYPKMVSPVLTHSHKPLT